VGKRQQSESPDATVQSRYELVRPFRQRTHPLWEVFTGDM
jgi:hypothetical protein